MTRPSVVHFGFDQPAVEGRPKVFLRTLLFSTAARGQVVERLFVRVERNGAGKATTFGFWAYGEAKQIVPGSDLYVPQTGVVTNHHFALAGRGADYAFEAGRYRLEVFAVPAGGGPIRLAHLVLELAPEHMRELGEGGEGVLFESDPDTGSYTATSRRPP